MLALHMNYAYIASLCDMSKGHRRIILSVLSERLAPRASHRFALRYIKRTRRHHVASLRDATVPCASHRFALRYLSTGCADAFDGYASASYNLNIIMEGLAAKLDQFIISVFCQHSGNNHAINTDINNLS